MFYPQWKLYILINTPGFLKYNFPSAVFSAEASCVSELNFTA